MHAFLCYTRLYNVVFASFCDLIFVEMGDVKEQRVCIKFRFKLGKNGAETHKMVKQSFGDVTLGQTLTHDWFNRFKNGRTSKSMLICFFGISGF